MIRLTRVRTDTIPERFRGVGRIENEKRLIEAWRDHVAARAGSFAYLKSSMWKPAKAQLEAESANKCGFCEAPAAVVTPCDVEHFRPKSLYWWLGLCYDNYLLACDICNRKYKGNQYPVEKRLKGPPVTATTTAARIVQIVNSFAPDPLDENADYRLSQFEQELRAENPELISPYFEDPEPFFRWEADETLGEVAIAPRKTRGPEKTRAESTIRILGLDRVKLRQARYQFYRPLDDLCLGVKAEIPPDLRARYEMTLRRAMEDKHTFAAMNRYVIRTIHGLTI
jgi:hypothetical protein